MSDQLINAIADMDEEGAIALTKELLAAGASPTAILDDCRAAMELVGSRFEHGEYFIPELILAGEMLKGVSAEVKPYLTGGQADVKKLGKVVIGTVKGDIHDIGKNLVGMMMEGAGFEVVDLGINNPVEKYLEALETEKPDILGMSALLTTTMPYMKVVIDTLKEKGMREDYIVLVGGAPLNEEFGKAIGADAYCRDAAVAVETAKAMVARKHNQL